VVPDHDNARSGTTGAVAEVCDLGTTGLKEAGYTTGAVAEVCDLGKSGLKEAGYRNATGIHNSRLSCRAIAGDG
jgi:hypothetical protein